MTWTQGAMLIWLAASVAGGVFLLGQPRTEIKVIGGARLLGITLLLLILVTGGFFRPAQAQAIPVAAQKHRALLIRTAHAAWGLDAPIAVFAAQVHQESAWRADAISPVGAQGLTQFMPATSGWIATMDPQLASRQPFNPGWALRAMVVYDRFLYVRTPARYAEFDRWWVVLRGYNGGLGHWQAEARSTGLRHPTRAQVDAACGQARRARRHCRENLGYARRILIVLQPRYRAWGPGL